MTKALVIQHICFENLGSLEMALIKHHYNIEYLEAWKIKTIDQITAADLVILLGAPVSVYDHTLFHWITDELNAVKARLTMKKPTLGICFGAQMIAQAAGGKVYAGHTKEIGWGNVIINSEGLRSPLKHLVDLPVFHWHGDTFDLPPHATHLASTQHFQNQAFSIGTHCLALQFHVEFLETQLESWLVSNTTEIVNHTTHNILRKQTAQYALSLKKISGGFWHDVLLNFEMRN